MLETEAENSPSPDFEKWKETLISAKTPETALETTLAEKLAFVYRETLPFLESPQEWQKCVVQTKGQKPILGKARTRPALHAVGLVFPDASMAQHSKRAGVIEALFQQGTDSEDFVETLREKGGVRRVYEQFLAGQPSQKVDKGQDRTIKCDVRFEQVLKKVIGDLKAIEKEGKDIYEFRAERLDGVWEIVPLTREGALPDEASSLENVFAALPATEPETDEVNSSTPPAPETLLNGTGRLDNAEIRQRIGMATGELLIN